MNEELVKKIVKYKLSTVDKILERLPSEISNNIRHFGKIINESINDSDSAKENSDIGKHKTKLNGKLSRIDIE